MGACVRIFEDGGEARLYPMTYLRPACDLRCGILLLREKVVACYPGADVGLFCRERIADLAAESAGMAVGACPSDGVVLLVNARVIWDEALSSSIRPEGAPCAYVCGGTLVAVRVDAALAARFARGGRDMSLLADLPREEVSARVVDYLWDLVRFNSDEIAADFRRLVGSGSIEGRLHDGAVVLGREHVYVARGASVAPGVVIDGESGPVYIGEGASILPNSVIEGPAAIGAGCRINPAARILSGTSLGPVCRIGGEIEESIVQGFSNKQHDGFLGHSYLGEWVNIGAGSSNSDLKNNYAPVRCWAAGRMVDTGLTFVGLFMGDHSKCAIGTMFNTGTVVGVGCNVFGRGVPPKYIPSFTWGGVDGAAEYDLARFFETARRVMARRDRELTPAAEGVLRAVFEATSSDRTCGGQGAMTAS